MKKSVLVITSWFPNKYEPTKCVFTKNMLDAQTSQGKYQYKVISPVPYFPQINIPFIPIKYLAYSKLSIYENDSNYAVYRPKYFKLPNSLSHSIDWFIYLLSIMNVIKRNNIKFDLVHSHGLYPDGYVAVKIGNHFKIPCIIHVHESYLEDVCIHYKRKINAIVQKASRLIVVSDYQKSILHKFYSRYSDKITTVYNGVDINKFNIYSNIEDNSQTGHKIIFIGNLIHVKGIDILIKAINMLQNVDIRINLDIYGKGVDEDRYIDLVSKLNLSNCITFKGPVQNDKLAKIINRYSILILPSRYETFGIVQIEAMACGIPVIASNVGAIPEVLSSDEVGIIIEPNNPQSLADGIKSAIAKKWNREVIRSHALKFSIDKYVHEIELIYEKTLANESSGQDATSH